MWGTQKNVNVWADTCTSMKKEYKSSNDSICLTTEISTMKEEFSLVKEEILDWSYYYTEVILEKRIV